MNCPTCGRGTIMVVKVASLVIHRCQNPKCNLQWQVVPYTAGFPWAEKTAVQTFKQVIEISKAFIDAIEKPYAQATSAKEQPKVQVPE